MNEKENKDIYYYVDEAYELVVNKYLENDELDRDIDTIFYKFEDIIYDTCSDYIMYDDLAEQLLMGNIADLTDFAYYMSFYLNIDIMLIDLIEDTRRICNFYLIDLLFEKLNDILTSELDYRIEAFEDTYRKKNKDITSKEAVEQYRKMVTNILLG